MTNNKINRQCKKEKEKLENKEAITTSTQTTSTQTTTTNNITSDINDVSDISGNINTEIKKNDYKKNVFFNHIFTRRHLINKSIYINLIFWVTSIIGVSLLSIQSYTSVIGNIWYCICGFITYCNTILLGYLSHYISHHNNFVSMYKRIINEYFNGNINNSFHQAMIKIIDYSMDYHDVYHHDSSINKQPYYLFLEALNNIWMQGGCWIIYIYIFSLNINIYNILLWCLVYSSFHNINYNIIEEPLIHQEHHKNMFTNIGIDIVDVIFDSKYDDAHIENINHYAINIAIITCILLYFKWRK